MPGASTRVARNASFVQLQNCLVTMVLYFFAVPAPSLLFWAISLCTTSVFIPIENPHLTIVQFGKLCRFTLNQPLTLFLCSSIKCVSEPCPNDFPYFPDASDLIQCRDDAKLCLDHAFENSVAYTSTLCATSPDFPRVYCLCSVERNQYSNPMNRYNSSAPSWPR